MLARVGSARATTDVDLFHHSRSLDAALEDLRRLAAIDLGDFFRFEYTGHTAAVADDRQTDAQGYRVSFDTYIVANEKDRLHVDLVVNTTITDDTEVSAPANALDLPKLAGNPYRLYPTVDQLADKVCATLVLYNGRPSTREKDLVDLVVLAVTQDVDATKLRRALEVESSARSLSLPHAFEIPTAWGARYARLASNIPACTRYRSITSAVDLMRVFIDPVLDGNAAGKAWDHLRLGWV